MNTLEQLTTKQKRKYIISGAIVVGILGILFLAFLIDGVPVVKTQK
jgi:hypothetical protein